MGGRCPSFRHLARQDGAPVTSGRSEIDPAALNI